MNPHSMPQDVSVEWGGLQNGPGKTALSTKLFYGFGAAAFGEKQNAFAIFVTAYRISRTTPEENLRKLAMSSVRDISRQQTIEGVENGISRDRHQSYRRA